MMSGTPYPYCKNPPGIIPWDQETALTELVRYWERYKPFEITKESQPVPLVWPSDPGRIMDQVIDGADIAFIGEADRHFGQLRKAGGRYLFDSGFGRGIQDESDYVQRRFEDMCEKWLSTRHYEKLLSHQPYYDDAACERCAARWFDRIIIPERMYYGVRDHVFSQLLDVFRNGYMPLLYRGKYPLGFWYAWCPSFYPQHGKIPKSCQPTPQQRAVGLGKSRSKLVPVAKYDPPPVATDSWQGLFGNGALIDRVRKRFSIWAQTEACNKVLEEVVSQVKSAHMDGDILEIVFCSHAVSKPKLIQSESNSHILHSAINDKIELLKTLLGRDLSSAELDGLEEDATPRASEGDHQAISEEEGPILRLYPPYAGKLPKMPRSLAAAMRLHNGGELVNTSRCVWHAMKDGRFDTIIERWWERDEDDPDNPFPKVPLLGIEDGSAAWALNPRTSYAEGEWCAQAIDAETGLTEPFPWGLGGVWLRLLRYRVCPEHDQTGLYRPPETNEG